MKFSAYFLQKLSYCFIQKIARIICHKNGEKQNNSFQIQDGVKIDKMCKNVRNALEDYKVRIFLCI